MTDEIDKLRQKIYELERELTVRRAGGEKDPAKAALVRAGVPLAQLADAAKIFKPSGNLKSGIFQLDGTKGNIDELAAQWLSERPWFGNAMPEPKAEPEANTQPRIENGRAIFADGSSLDIELLDADALLSMAGEAPKPKAPEPKPDEAYINEGEADVDRDWRLAGATPKAAS